MSASGAPHERSVDVDALPQIIQGGMGVAVSDWRLARAVARRGQLGVVSGTGLDTVFVRRLQDGDADRAVRSAMKAFPIPGVADRALDRYYRPNGRAAGEPYQLLSMYRQVASREREAVTMLAAFSEVYLAKEGHDGLVGINLPHQGAATEHRKHCTAPCSPAWTTC